MNDLYLNIHCDCDDIIVIGGAESCIEIIHDQKRNSS